MKTSFLILILIVAFLSSFHYVLLNEPIEIPDPVEAHKPLEPVFDLQTKVTTEPIIDFRAIEPHRWFFETFIVTVKEIAQSLIPRSIRKQKKFYKQSISSNLLHIDIGLLADAVLDFLILDILDGDGYMHHLKHKLAKCTFEYGLTSSIADKAINMLNR